MNYQLWKDLLSVFHNIHTVPLSGPSFSAIFPISIQISLSQGLIKDWGHEELMHVMEQKYFQNYPIQIFWNNANWERVLKMIYSWTCLNLSLKLGQRLYFGVLCSLDQRTFIQKPFQQYNCIRNLKHIVYGNNFSWLYYITKCWLYFVLLWASSYQSSEEVLRQRRTK